MSLIVFCQVLLDATCLLIASAPSFALILYARPYHRGFYCDDQSIRYPYHPDTVTSAELWAVCYILPLITFAIVELIRFLIKKRNTDLRKDSILQSLAVFIRAYEIFFFGSMVTLSITTIGKYTVGRLRPHFLSVCQPLPEVLINCTRSDSKEYLRFITEDVCTKSQDDHLMVDSRLSFPSGHSSASCYTAVFIAMYLYVRMRWRFSALLKPCVQALLIFAAVFVCLSRINDNMHHWSDVLAGAFLGCFIAALTCIYILDQYIALAEDGDQHYEVLKDGVISGSAKANEMP